MVLAGKTEAVSTSEIIEDLTEANADVETMAGLIEELEAALEGKSVEGGESAVETCTVVLDANMYNYRPYHCSYTIVDDAGNITGAAIKDNTALDITLSNVICGSAVTIYWGSGNGLTMTNTTIIESAIAGDGYFTTYLVAAPAGGTVTIKNASTNSGGST